MSRANRFQRAFLLLLVVAISVAFVTMIRDFLLVIFLAAIFAGLCHPIYAWLERHLRGHRAAASALTLLFFCAVVLGPLATVAGIVARQALHVSQNVGPRVKALVQEPTLLDEYLRHVPGYDRLEPYREQILTRAAELIGTAGSALFRSLSGTLGGTLLVIVQFVIFLYTMFFLLMDGRAMLDRILQYLPLGQADKARMIERFASVTRATLKGTLLIGVTQGVLCGLAFWVVGIEGAVFWGTIMIVLSIVPGVGGALVWVPASIVLVATGAVWRGLGLALFCGLIVGSIDNVMRPRLVGRDTQLHDLLIFFSTLGGLLMFGPMGFIVGPILAALFVTVWDIYAVTFRQELDHG